MDWTECSSNKDLYSHQKKDFMIDDISSWNEVTGFPFKKMSFYWVGILSR